jgi:hypothetical protein
MSDTIPEDLLKTTGTDSAASADVVAPTQEPPASALAAVGTGAAGGVAATVWVNGKKVNALWAINQNRNSWISVVGVGWVKLANNSDSAIVALTMLGANAKLTQGVVNYRQESDNMIHEMYVW